MPTKKITKIVPWKFAHHSGVPKDPPDVADTHIPLVERFARGEKLTRDEKNLIAERMYRYNNNSPTYKLAGWLWDLRPCLNRYLVQMEWPSGWMEFYAPDKTALRKAKRGHGRILEIVGPIRNRLTEKLAGE